MKRNTMIAFVALALMLVVGAGASYWAIKKYRQKQNQEFRVEGVMQGHVREGFDQEAFKKLVLVDDVLDKVIEKHQLVATWGTGDAATARARIRGKFSTKVGGTTLTVRYQDKDKELAKKILESIMEIFYSKNRPASP